MIDALSFLLGGVAVLMIELVAIIVSVAIVARRTFPINKGED